MGDKSQIQWTDATWNPTTGCSKVSPGCKNCYAERIFPRAYGKLRAFTDVRCHEDRLQQPLKWKRPRKIFVNSMSDLFHEDVPYEFIDKVFSVMGGCDDAGLGHVFQILTKRPHSMLDYMTHRARAAWNSRRMNRGAFPPRNVWLGVSLEDQQRADERIPLLLQTPAAVRFVSYEPALGPVSFDSYPGPLRCDGCGYTKKDKTEQADHRLCKNPTATLDWVIVGGESGRSARGFETNWARSVVEQCKSAGVACFVKQLGSNPHHQAQPIKLKDGHGGNMEEWPEDLRIRQFPEVRA